MDFFSDDVLFYYLALSKVDGVGPVFARKIALKYPNLKELFENKPIDSFACEGVPNGVFEKIKMFKKNKIIENEIRFIRDNKIDVLSVLDDNYPMNLKQCYDAPFILFSKGNIDFENDRIISIVGTRNITSYGSGFVKELIQDLKKYNPLIVSGYAYGADICAHLAALENDLQTVAVLGQSLETTYPKVHKKYNNLVMENGGFLTEFSISDKASKENFIKRNRIVAGLSKATIVIESALKGGSLSTAKFANDYNRDVFALPGRISDSFSLGCNHLIKTNQANLLTSVQDLVYYLNWDKKTQEVIKEKAFEIPSDLSSDELKVVVFLKEKGSQILDVIALETEIPVYKLSVILLNLELRNLVVPLPGKLFDLKK
mgnify:CR=1 FL=1